MPPRSKKTPPAADTATVNGADLEAMRDEVATENQPTPAADDDTWPRLVPIGDATVRVKHWLDWELDSDQHLAVVDIRSWAEGVVVEDDFINIWKPAKPTLRQGLAFVKAVEVETGIPFAPHLASLTT